MAKIFQNGIMLRIQENQLSVGLNLNGDDTDGHIIALDFRVDNAPITQSFQVTPVQMDHLVERWATLKKLPGIPYE